MFARYRDMGPDRSLTRLADDDEVTIERRQLARYSSDHRWAQRTDAWDVEQDRIRREAAAMDREELDRKGLEAANAMIEFAHKRIKALDEHGGKVAPGELAKFMETGVKIQRLLMGESTQITETKTETIEQYLERLRLAGKEPLWQ